MFKATMLAAVLAAVPLAHAQTAPASSPAKKELIAKMLQLQQPGIEAMARTLVEQPARMLMQQAGIALQRVPADKREGIAREIETDIRKYAEEVVPIVRDQAIKIAPTTIGAVVDQHFSEDELRQMIVLLESPVNKKFQSLAPEMQRSLGEKLVADSKAIVEPKLRALEQSIAKNLGATPAAAPAPAKKK